MSIGPLISPQTLLEIHKNRNVIIVDCRFDLMNDHWGETSYAQTHIPGAIFADLNLNLSARPHLNTGRHPLPDPKIFVQYLASLGVDPQDLVVVYDTVGGSFAGRFWWMMRAIGHKNVQLLDGGMQKWEALGYPIENGINQPIATLFQYKAEFDASMFVTTSEVEKLYKSSSIKLIDARSPERFRGENETIDPVAGHIPGAVNRFHGLNLSSDGTFKSPQMLRQEYSEILGQVPPHQAIVYCGSGVSSCHHLIAMETAGLSGGRLYVGSWSEWIRDTAHPIQTK